MKQSYILNIDELTLLTNDVIATCKNGVIILKGDLASGKTTFVKHLAKQLGCDDDITSPTFSLQQCYSQRIFHYDIYNHGVEHFISLGMLEELDKDGIHLVEWGNDELKEILISAGFHVLLIEINKISTEKREYLVEDLCIH